MPIYEYTCPECGHAFEELVRSSGDADRQKCPKCGKKARRRLSVFSASVASPAPSAPAGGCGSCGMDPGSCPYSQ